MNFRVLSIWLAIFTAVFSSSYAQDYDIKLTKYDWDKSLTVNLTNEEKNLPSLIVFKKNFVEFSYNEKGNFQKHYVVHTLKYVNDNRSIEENNKVYVPLTQEQGLINIKNRIYENGKLIAESGMNDIITMNEENNVYKIIALKGVKKGCFIETLIIMQLSESVYDDEYFQGSVPVNLAEFTLISPKKLAFACKTYNTSQKVKDTVVNDRRFSYVKMTKLPVLEKDEKYASINANQIRLEYTFSENKETGKKFVRWPDIGKNYFDRVYTDYDKNSKDAEKLVKKANIGSLSTEDEKIFALEAYIKSNMDLQANAPQEESVAKMVKNKYVNEYGMVKLLLTCFKKAGIATEIVITCKKGYKLFDPDFDSWSFARNVLIYFPKTGKYIDPENAAFRYPYINNDYFEQSGIFIRTVEIGDVASGVTSIKKITPPDFDKNQDFETYTVSLSPDLVQTTILYDRKMYNYADQNIRLAYYFLDKDKKKELIDPFIKGFAKNAVVSDLQVQNYNILDYKEYTQPLVINAKVTTDHYNERADDKVIFRFGELIGPQMEMYQEKTRQNPIDIEFPHNYQRKITFKIPAGYTVKGLEKLKINYVFNKDGKPAYGFVSDYKITETELVVSCNEYYNLLSYPKSDIDSFRKVINAAADFNKISIVLVKK